MNEAAQKLQKSSDRYHKSVLGLVVTGLVLGLVAMTGLALAQGSKNQQLNDRIGYLEGLLEKNKPVLDRIDASTNTLICMGLVPQTDRTKDTAQNCRKQATVSISAPSQPVVSSAPRQSSQVQVSSPNSVPKTDNKQGDNSQQDKSPPTLRQRAEDIIRTITPLPDRPKL